uniref:Putative secreted protein n=1 Tax=Anopheles darlingi TaxID=43151 RepID=A0A2M4D6B7_ANODA
MICAGRSVLLPFLSISNRVFSAGNVYAWRSCLERVMVGRNSNTSLASLADFRSAMYESVSWGSRLLVVARVHKKDEAVTGKSAPVMFLQKPRVRVQPYRSIATARTSGYPTERGDCAGY